MYTGKHIGDGIKEAECESSDLMKRRDKLKPRAIRSYKDFVGQSIGCILANISVME